MSYYDYVRCADVAGHYDVHKKMDLTIKVDQEMSNWSFFRNNQEPRALPELTGSPDI